MIYLIILFTISFFFLAWRRLDFAVMFTVAALPAYLIRFSVFGLPSTLLEIMIWAVFLVWLTKNFSRVKSNFLKNFKKGDRNIKIRYPFDWEIIMLLLIALAAAGIAGFSTASLGIFKAYFFEPALFFIVVLNVMKGEKGREKILWALAVSALAVSLLAIYQKITGQLIGNPLWAAEGTRRVVSFFGYPNAVGLYLGPIVLVMAGWLAFVISVKNNLDSSFRGNDKGKVVPRNYILIIVFINLTIILSLLSIYFTKSKGALLGVAAGLVVFGLLAEKKIRWTTLAVIIIATAGIAAYLPARNLAIENITLTNKSGQIRMAGWSDSWRMLKDGRLLTGAGLANYQMAIAPYHTEGIFFKDHRDSEAQRKLVYNETYRTAHWQPLEIYLYPHNIFLNFWSELGLAGMLLFVWVVVKYFWLEIKYLVIAAPEPQSRNMGSAKTWISGQARNDKKRQEYLVIGLIGAMVAIVIHGLVDVPYFKNDLAVMFWLFIAMMSMIKLERESY